MPELRRPTIPAAALIVTIVLALALALALASTLARAGVPTLPDCVEGSDFIANAAHSRNNGVRRDTFITRMEEDFIVIRAFPPALRWFVKDQDDERLLLDAVAAVYDRPRSPAQHHADFLAACLQRLGA